ncbi:MAG TPA: hypothetical protein PJ982_05065, partial [Lacipirellulaceae bacterium]|nr:hypothetical protein [Lacipirellulaceae bacterium]
MSWPAPAGAPIAGASANRPVSGSPTDGAPNDVPGTPCIGAPGAETGKGRPNPPRECPGAWGPELGDGGAPWGKFSVRGKSGALAG